MTSAYQSLDVPISTPRSNVTLWLSEGISGGADNCNLSADNTLGVVTASSFFLASQKCRISSFLFIYCIYSFERQKLCKIPYLMVHLPKYPQHPDLGQTKAEEKTQSKPPTQMPGTQPHETSPAILKVHTCRRQQSRPELEIIQGNLTWDMNSPSSILPLYQMSSQGRIYKRTIIYISNIQLVTADE